MWSTESARPGLYLAGCFFLFFVPVVLTPFSGHDWQRTAHVVVAFLSLITLIRYAIKHADITFLGVKARFACLLLTGLGVLSAINSHQVSWAFVEAALLLAACAIAGAFAVERKAGDATYDRLVLTFVIVLCSVKTVQFFSAVAAVFISGVDVLDTSLLFNEFSNVRTYGQFQTFTLPLLALPLLLPTVKRSTRAWTFALLACWWMIAICGGTRGTWLGMAAASVLLSCLAPGGRRWASWQLGAALAGGLLYWLWFSLLPSWMDIRVINPASDRLTTDLSARGVIWQQAWEMIEARPLLGFGPMHFADIPNNVAAHPHQSVLQWACEWGVPSALLVSGLALRGLGATALLIRSKATSTAPEDVWRLCLFASLMGALTQSMVDGVIVMPYSQLWLCLVVGWLMGMHQWKVSPEPAAPILTRAWLVALVCAVTLLGYVVVRDFPHLEEKQQQYAREFGGHFQPRFWMQGVIAIKAQ